MTYTDHMAAKSMFISEALRLYREGRVFAARTYWAAAWASWERAQVARRGNA